MSPTELRASIALASIFALRMLGLFLLLPVFAIHLSTLPGSDSGLMIGLALGVYGLAQGLLQIPYGVASDRMGRKPVIVFGLILFAAGSVLAGCAHSVEMIALGRAIQGMGAISAAVTALIADSTREEHRTKAMAMVGASIGLTFAVSLVAAPALYGWIGLSGMFFLTGVLAVAAIAVVVWVVPSVPATPRLSAVSRRALARQVLRHPQLQRLNAGVFVLHVTQIALFASVPQLLVEFGALPTAQHWKVYLPVILLSSVCMMPFILAAERRGRTRRLFLCAIAGMAAMLSLGPLLSGGLWALGVFLLGFFTAFNILEAMQPSLVSRLAPAGAKGFALGIYNSVQGLGLFLGGVLGGTISARWGASAVYQICALIVLAWLAYAWGMQVPARSKAVPAS